MKVEGGQNTAVCISEMEKPLEIRSNKRCFTINRLWARRYILLHVLVECVNKQLKIHTSNFLLYRDWLVWQQKMPWAENGKYLHVTGNNKKNTLCLTLQVRNSSPRKRECKEKMVDQEIKMGVKPDVDTSRSI